MLVAFSPPSQFVTLLPKTHKPLHAFIAWLKAEHTFPKECCYKRTENISFLHPYLSHVPFPQKILQHLRPARGWGRKSGKGTGETKHTPWLESKVQLISVSVHWLHFQFKSWLGSTTHVRDFKLDQLFPREKSRNPQPATYLNSALLETECLLLC